MSHLSPTEHRRSQHKSFLIAALVIIWLVGSLLGLWWFQQQAVRPFVLQSDSGEARNLSSVRAGVDHLLKRIVEQADKRIDSRSPLSKDFKNQAILIHLWNPDCLCNNVSQRHLDAIHRQYSKQQLLFVILAPETTSDERINEMQVLNPDAFVMRTIATDNIPLTASPGLAVISPSHELAYFGAYGFGALCSLSDDNLFTNMIDALLKGESYGPFLNIAGSGCFCAWPQTTSQNSELTD